MTKLPRSATRFQTAAEAAGLVIDIVEMAESTRTAKEAALACGCTPAQIVKSLVFRGASSKKPYLFLVSGKNRVDQNGFAGLIGEKLDRPSADYVREITGYSIGGIPPLGHAQPIATFIDQDLLDFEQIFAAAGTPRCIFAATPDSLRAACGAKIANVKAPA